MRFLFLLGYCLVKHFNNIIQFSSIFLLTKQVLLKTIVIVAGKLTRSRVLRGGLGLHVALRGGDGARKLSLSCEAGRGWGKTKPCERGRRPHPSDSPRPIAIPS